jgi:hypothetical protein
VTKLTSKTYYAKMSQIAALSRFTRQEADAVLGKHNSYGIIVDALELGHLRRDGSKIHEGKRKDAFLLMKKKEFFDEELAKVLAPKVKTKPVLEAGYWQPWALGFCAHDPFNLVNEQRV